MQEKFGINEMPDIYALVRFFIFMNSLLRKLSFGSSSIFSHVASKTSAPSIPPNLHLVAVACVHRHGDRSQIAKMETLGPIYNTKKDDNDKTDYFIDMNTGKAAKIDDNNNNNENANILSIKSLWKDKMPIAESMKCMNEAAIEDKVDDPASSTYPVLEFTPGDSRLDETLYSGWERNNYPYGQLTEKGFQELFTLGQELRKRYIDTGLLGDSNSNTVDGNLFYCRSTNFCRTKQSLRSLISGILFDPVSNSMNSKNDVKIFARPKTEETMFPQADGPCSAIAMRRAELFADDYIAQNFKGLKYNYHDLNEIVGNILGYTDNNRDTMNWLSIREILVCHHVHNVPLPKNITEDMIIDIDRLSGFMWNRLFSDDIFNRLAIGRFLKEFKEMLEKVLTNRGGSSHKVMIYSGHDSTLVPILCALVDRSEDTLNISSDDSSDSLWPPYASHFEIEIARNSDDDQLYVRALFNNEEMKIHGCKDVWCPYYKVKRRLDDIIITSELYHMECNEAEGLGAAADQQMEAEIKATTGGA